MEVEVVEVEVEEVEEEEEEEEELEFGWSCSRSRSRKVQKWATPATVQYERIARAAVHRNCKRGLSESPLIGLRL